MMLADVIAAKQYVESGKLRPLGVTSARRSSVMPEVPTIAEAGVPGYEATSWNMLLAPAGTPRAIIDRLNAEVTKATSAPEMREAWARQGASAMTLGPDEFARFMREDIEKWARIVKISGARPDQ